MDEDSVPLPSAPHGFSTRVSWAQLPANEDADISPAMPLHYYNADAIEISDDDKFKIGGIPVV